MSPKKILQIVLVLVLMVLIGGEIYFLIKFSKKARKQEIKPSSATEIVPTEPIKSPEPIKPIEATFLPSATKPVDKEFERLLQELPFDPNTFEGIREANPDQGVYGVMGIVSQINPDSFEVSINDEKMQFLVTGETVFQARPFNIEPGNIDLKPLEFEDLKIGDQLDLLFKRNENFQSEAYSVHVIRN